MAKNKAISSAGKPMVSVCTPTADRRRFIPALIGCFEAQSYPRELLEWVVVDDGSDPVGDLFEGVEGVKYIRREQRMTLGQKRNYMHTQARGEIIVYMDDDDYYPPDRVQHAVNKLRSKPGILIAGSSIMHICFNKFGKIYRFGPYGPNHATAATFAFRRRLLEKTAFADDATVSEERYFLKNFTIPMVQLDSKKTILVFAHDFNTFDKKKLLSGANRRYVRETRFNLRIFIKDEALRDFYGQL